MITKNQVLNLFLAAGILFITACSGEQNEEADSAIVAGSETLRSGEEIANEATSDLGSSNETQEMVDVVATEGADIENTYTDQYGNIVYTIVEQKPTFEGGDQELYKFLSSNLKYPEEAIDKNAEGTVHVAFVVSKEGAIRDVELAHGLAESSLNEEAMRVVSKMPNWTPGVQTGEKVDVKYTLPVKFDLKN